MATLGLPSHDRIDQMDGYFRFAYGVVELGDGIGVDARRVGLFGLLRSSPPPARKRRRPSSSRRLLSCAVAPGVEGRETGHLAWHGARFPDRIIPGSAHITRFVSYAVERRLAGEPEEFGQARWPEWPA